MYIERHILEANYNSKIFIIKKFHPPIDRKTRILNGIDINVGGSIIIPIEIKTAAIAISITKNGR